MIRFKPILCKVNGLEKANLSNSFNKFWLLLAFILIGNVSFCQSVILMKFGTAYQELTGINSNLTSSGFEPLGPFMMSGGVDVFKKIEDRFSFVFGINLAESWKEFDTLSLSHQIVGLNSGIIYWLKTKDDLKLGFSGKIWLNSNRLELDKTNAKFPNSFSFNLNNPQWQSGRFYSSGFSGDVGITMLYNERKGFAYGAELGTYINIPNKKHYSLQNYPQVVLPNTKRQLMLVPYLKVQFTWSETTSL